MLMIRVALMIAIFGLLGLGLGHTFGLMDESLVSLRASQWMIAAGMLLLAGFLFQLIGLKSKSVPMTSEAKSLEDAQKTEDPPIL